MHSFVLGPNFCGAPGRPPAAQPASAFACVPIAVLVVLCCSGRSIASVGAMASGKLASPSAVADEGMRQALMRVRLSCAHRAKFRVGESGPQPLGPMGSHQGNRGGVYANTKDVENLAEGIWDMGFDPEEADSQGVAVQDYPEGQRPPNYVTIHNWNRLKTEGIPGLVAVVSDDHVISLGLLSHNHLLLVLKGFAHAAKWDVPKLCGPDGKASLAKLRLHDAEFAKKAEGFLKIEVLSWRIMVEEPRAAALISKALNDKNRLALLPHEMEIFKVLCNEVSTSVSSAVAEEVLFAGIKEKARAQLDHLVDEPEMVSLVKLIVDVGGENGECIPDFVEFTERLVNHKVSPS